MANEQNLIPGGHKLTREEQSKGGKASAEARAKKKLFKEILDEEFEKKVKVTKNGEVSSDTVKNVVGTKVVQFLLDKDISVKDFVKVLEFARDTIGEKPVDKMEHLNADIVINLGDEENE